MKNLTVEYVIKLFRFFVYSFVVFVLIVCLAYFVLRLPASQRHLIGKVENYLEHKLNTKVSIKTIDLWLPKAIGVTGFYLADQNQDTLVYLDRLKVDIDPFALYSHRVKVNSFELDGPVCFLKREHEDSVFNYDFISQSLESIPNEPNEKESDWTFEIDQFLISNSRFFYSDLKDSIYLKSKFESVEFYLKEYDFSSKLNKASYKIKELESLFTTSSESLEFSFKEHFLNLNQLNLKTSQIDIKEANLIEPMLLHEKRKNMLEPVKSDSAGFNMTIPWKIACAKLTIEDASLIHDDLNYPDQTGFDLHHLDIKGFSTLLKSISSNEDGFTSQLISLNLTEGDEFEIKNANVDFTVSDSLLKLDKLAITTLNSNFEGNLQVGYSDMEQLTALSEGVEISHQLGKSKVGSEDLLYFLPDLNNSEIPIESLNSIDFQWQLEGTLGDFNINHLRVHDREVLACNLDGRIQHILNPDSIIFDVELELKNSLIQRLKAHYLKGKREITLPTQMALRSKIYGDLKNLSFKNKLMTNKGSINIQGNFLNQDVPSYKVEVKLSELDVGYLFNQPTLGTIDMNINANGKGKELNQSELELESQVNQFNFGGYSYRGINILGNVKNKNAYLKLQILDPNLHTEILSTVDFTNALTKTKVNIDITKALFQNLGLTSDDIQASGSVLFDIKGTNTDSLDVSIMTNDARVIKNGLVHETSPSSIRAHTGSNMSFVEIDFPFLKAYFKSNFPISNLQQALTQEIIPNLVSDTVSSKGKDYQMEFSITQFKQKILSNLLLPELKSLELKDFKGFYDGQSNKASLLIDIPSLTYQDMHFDSLYVKANTNNPGFNFSGFLKKLSIGGFTSHSIDAKGNAIKGVTKLSFELLDSLANKSLSVNTEIHPIDSGYQIFIVQDSVVIGYENWHVNTQNEIKIKPQGINIQNFSFTKNEESFSFYSEDTLKNMPIYTKFNQFDLGYISNLAGSLQRPFSGNLDGEIVLHDISSELAFESDLLIKDFTYSDDKLGDIKLLTRKTSQDTYDISFGIKGTNTEIDGTGYYSSASDSMKINLMLKEFDISSVDGFSAAYLKNLKGQLTGNLEAVGLIHKPSFSGKLNFHDVSFNTVYLGSFFNFKNEFIELKDDKIYFDHFKIYDINKNLATINGFVGSSDLESYNFNLDISTNKFELLNTKPSGNKDELYFGNLIVSSDLRMRGNSSKPVINANTKVIGGSELTIIVPKTQSETIEHEGIVRFVTQDSSLHQIDNINTNSSGLIGISLQADLEISPEAKLKIIIDQDAGDFLEVKGKSAMSYTIDPTGEANLSGTYEVAEGVYNLTFYNFLKKQFTLKKGSKIRWTGDPYDAILDASASYTVNTSPLPLIESQLSTSHGASESAYQQILPFIVNLNIDGEISKPQIQFEIEMPANKQSFQGGVVNGKIQQLNAQESELNKQVFSLLLFNRFLPENSFSGGASGALSSTARNSVSKLLTQQLNGLTGKYIKGITINTDIESFEDYSTGSARGRTDLKLELSKELFNEKLVVKVGSNVPLEGDQKQSGVRNLAQDIVLEYKLDEEGSYRLKAFRKNQYEGIIDGELTKTGIGMILGREFDSWEELLLSLKLTKKQ